VAPVQGLKSCEALYPPTLTGAALIQTIFAACWKVEALQSGGPPPKSRDDKAFGRGFVWMRTGAT